MNTPKTQRFVDCISMTQKQKVQFELLVCRFETELKDLPASSQYALLIQKLFQIEFK